MRPACQDKVSSNPSRSAKPALMFLTGSSLRQDMLFDVEDLG
jgi:hypothetical protein